MTRRGDPGHCSGDPVTSVGFANNTSESDTAGFQFEEWMVCAQCEGEAEGDIDGDVTHI